MPRMVPGIASSEDAKMIGITPDMFTFTGMKVDWPPYILRPITRLAYCTGIRRSALVIMMIATISTRKSAIIKTTETMLEKLYSFRRIYRPLRSKNFMWNSSSSPRMSLLKAG